MWLDPTVGMSFDGHKAHEITVAIGERYLVVFFPLAVAPVQPSAWAHFAALGFGAGD